MTTPLSADHFSISRDELDELESLHTELMESAGGLRLFVEDAWPILEPAVTFSGNWHIDAMCAHLEAVTRGEIQNLIITVPPRHMKSLTVAVLWPCWEWGPAASPAFDEDGINRRKADTRWKLPSLKWIFSSYAQSLSERDSQKRRRLLHSPFYRARWGHIVKIGQEKFLADGQLKYENSRLGYHLATSVDGSNTGEGGDRIVIDDPIKVSEAQSDTVREKVNIWYDETMSTRRNNPATCARIIIMQRTHDRDLVGHIVEKYEESHVSNYVHLNLPTRFEEPSRSRWFRDPRTEIDQLLWPARFPETEIVQAEIDLGPLAFSAQHQQSPSPASGAEFLGSWLRFYAPSSSSLVGMLDTDTSSLIRKWKTVDKAVIGHPIEELPSCSREWLSLDAAFKDLDTSDYVAGQAWGRDGAYRFLLDQFRARLSFTRTVDALRELHSRYPRAIAVLIEDKANGTAVVDTLRRELSGVQGVAAVESKVARARATHPLWRAGQVFLPHPTIAPWVVVFIKELLAFPFAAKDDQVDAMAHALINDACLGVFDESHFAQIDLG